MIDIFNINLLDIMPESLKSDPDVQALCDAITPEIQAISNEIIQCILLARIDGLPEEVLDLLAWQLRVDFYEPDLLVEQKRDLVRQSIAWHRRKGTPWAVEQVVSVVFKNAKVSEWFEYGGNPYHFRVETEQTITAETDLDRLVRMINATKNARSWMENVTIKRTVNVGLSYGGIFSEYRKTEIYPVTFVMPDISNDQFYGGIISFWNITTINPEVS